MIFNTGTSNSPLLRDPAYDQLRRQLGLASTQQRSIVPDGTDQIGQTFLRSNEGLGALGSLFASALQQQGDPVLARVLTRNLGDIINRYRAAVAVNNSLQPDEFLNQFDLTGYASQLSPYERGERPGVFTRGFKLLGG
jgi:hypothetical protein